MRGLNRRPIWMEVLVSAFVAFTVSSILVGVVNAISESAATAVLSTSLLVAGWGIFLLVRGLAYLLSKGVVRELGRQYVRIGGRIPAAGHRYGRRRRTR
jgi:hypothetical protein